jgi:putative ABC transport system permease protein
MERDEVLSISYMNDVKEQLDDMLKSLNLVIVVLIISAGMLAFVVLYNLNTINITERQRELATLKVLGFYDPEVAIYVFRENIMLTFLGAAAGVILGKVLTLFIIETVEVDAAMFGRVINISSFVYSLLFTIAFSIIINGIMYFKLKKIDMVESLKSIE